MSTPVTIIGAGPGDTEAALTEYERALFPRSIEATAEGSEAHELLFGAGTPYALLGIDPGDRP
jgi:hypothetical protein